MGKNKSGQKVRSKAQIAEDRARIMQYMRRGWTQESIAIELGVSQQQVSLDYRRILQDSLERRAPDPEEDVEGKLLELAEVKREAWLAWERSKEHAVETTEVDGTRGASTSVKRKGQVGDAKFLEAVLSCVKQERELRGLDAPKEMRVRGQVVNHNVDWNVFADLDSLGPLDQVGKDEVERKMLSMLSGRAVSGVPNKEGEGVTDG